MFTGIITDLGVVRSVDTQGDTRIVIACDYDMASVDLGASIACSGVCLTVVAKDANSFTVDVSAESIARTAPAMWQQGARLNLERALKVGDELGGHIVTGHVDGVGVVTSIAPVGASHDVAIRVPADIAPFIAAKGSVTVDGVSLTVNTVDDDADGSSIFHLNIIPHTWRATAFSALVEGQNANIEIDVLARYLARMKERLSILV